MFSLYVLNNELQTICSVILHSKLLLFMLYCSMSLSTCYVLIQNISGTVSALFMNKQIFPHFFVCFYFPFVSLFSSMMENRLMHMD